VHLIYSRREPDNTFSLILLKINGWDVSTQVVDRVAAAKTAQAEQKKKTKEETPAEKRYNPAEGTIPTGTYTGR
jgi:hypothetical protein